MIEKDLPKQIPVFPLRNAIFFPGTILPLNIFEERYIQLVNDCMKEKRLFGMVQPKNKIFEKPEVYNVGCLGKIVSFNETNDNRFIISLSGIIRFRINDEENSEKLYRKFNVTYSEFEKDLEFKKNNIANLKKDNFLKKVQIFFKKKNYLIELKELIKLNFDQLVNTVCMIAPFSNEEKQKLIETITIEDRIKLLDEIINFNLADIHKNKTIQ